MDFTNFRQNLKVVRASKGLAAKKLSENCGLKRLKRIADIEDGQGKPTIEEIAAICTELDLSIDDMLYGTVIIRYGWE